MKVAIYVRVSKSDGSQNPDRQIDELKKFCKKKKWSPTEIIIENVTGCPCYAEKRPQKNSNDQYLKS
jgi:DNA invertase Pin-like site-specific DNA recombinase